MVSDSITLNSMSGGSVVDTEVPTFRGNHLQRMKIAVGPVDSDWGDVTSTNPLPVLITNTTISGTTVSGTTWFPTVQTTFNTTTSGNQHTVVDNFPTFQTANQGAPANQANRWPTYLTDGANPLGTASNPLTISGTTSANILVPKRAGIAASSSGDNTIISAPTNGQRIYVYAFELSFSGTVNAKFTDGASGTLLGGLYYGIANAGAANSVAPNSQSNPPAPVLWVGSPNTALVLNLSGAVAVGGGVSYYIL